MVLHLLIDVLRNTVLITGLVIVMMMLIESLNIESRGLFFKGLEKTRVGQVVFAAMLGSIPGCMGGFAAVSLSKILELRFNSPTEASSKTWNVTLMILPLLSA